MTPIPGQKLPPLIVEAVSPDLMAEWAVFLDDPNPIHLDLAAVEAMGLGSRRINQGPMNAGYVVEALRRALPGHRLVDLFTSFRDNVFEGERLTVAAKVSDVGGDGTVTCDFTLTADGRVALSGQAVLTTLRG